MKQVSIIGVGLIGGSFALDLLQHISGVSITGIDQNETHLNEALELGIIHQTADVESVRSADLVVLALPVNAAINVLTEVLELISDQALSLIHI